MEFLNDYIVLIVMGICLCVGYVIKNIIPTDKINRFIPLIMGVLGVVLNVWVNLAFTPEILLGGLVSGLASTGLHQLFKQFIERGGKVIMKKFGIDISKWQGNFDFDKAIAEGVEFVIIKGGGGDDGLYTDSKFVRNYNEAKAKGLPVGCYWFSKARTIEEAENEAEYFYHSIVKGRKFELPVYMDVEHSEIIYLGKNTLTAIIQAFCNKLESYGCFVGIYSSLNYFQTRMNDAELQRYAHWVAQWHTECTYNGDENVLGMWQFGGETNLIRTNKIAGVTCDQNYMLVDYPSMIKAAGCNGFVNATTGEVKPVLKSVEEIAKEVIAGKWGNGDERRDKLTKSGYNFNEVQKRVDEIMSTEDKTIIEGDKVKLSNSAVIYGTDEKFAPYIYKTVLYVREIKGKRVVISTLESGAVTGAVDIKYLTKA